MHWLVIAPSIAASIVFVYFTRRWRFHWFAVGLGALHLAWYWLFKYG